MTAEKTRLQLSLQIAYGDRLLANPERFALKAIDDKLERSTGMNRWLVPTGTTDQEIDLATQGGSNDARFLLVVSDKEISLKLNDVLNTAVWLSPQTEDPFGSIIDPDIRKDGLLLLRSKGINKLFISNASGYGANVRVFACALAA